MPQPIDGGPERHAALQAKLVEHLEAARALADQTGAAIAAYLIESALIEMRAITQADNFDFLAPRC